MPYKEIGTTIDPTNFKEISISSYYFAGQWGGIYAYQSYAASLTTSEIAYLNGLDLNTVKTYLENTGLVTIQYMKMSWNETGTTITDFVLGMVYFVRKTTYGGAIRDHLPPSLHAIIEKLHMIERPDFKFYLDEGRSLAYHYTWQEKLAADKYGLDVSELPPTDDALKQSFISDGRLQDALNAFVAKCAESDTVISIKTFRVQASTEDLGVIGLPTTGFKHMYRSRVTLEVDFDSDRPITSSPIAPFIVLAIGIAIITISAAVSAAVVMYFNNISSVSSNVTTRITNPSGEPVTVQTPQGVVTIPPGGTYEYTESTTGGIITQLPLIAAVIGVIVVAALIAYMFLNPRKRKK